MSRTANEMQSGLIAYLQGYGRNNRAGLSAIAAYGAWPVLAAQEIEQRMARFLESLPLDEVRAIALEILDIECLELQRIRSKDYREISVWDLWRALQAAYLAGMVDHHRSD